MQYINTTFAHGNGPFSRIVDWAIAVNNERESRRMQRLPIVVPLVYPGRQERIMKEEISSNTDSDFLQKHPIEIWLDRTQGEIIARLMFKGKDYSENLKCLAKNYSQAESDIQRHLDGKREIETIDGKVDTMDLRDCAFQLGLNNRIQTGLPNQFYTAGGAGPFDEILKRAILDEDIILDKESMLGVLPSTERMIENQVIIFSNEPGVFSYDESRRVRENEVYTPPFIHFPKPDFTKLAGKGIYLLMTGIDGVRENGMYDAVLEFGMQIYAPSFSINNLPERIRKKAIPLNPNQMNNQNIVVQYARAGWSTVWLSHMAEKGFITPPYQKTDDPEMLFNERGIRKLKLGEIIEGNPRSSLEKALEFAQHVKSYNQGLIQRYGTLDGINYASKRVVDYIF